MKNDNPQEIKTVYVQEKNTVDNEVSLVDIALILIRRKRLFVSVFIISITLGIAAIQNNPTEYTVSSTISIGRQILGESVVLFEQPESLLAKFEHGYITQALTDYKKENPDYEQGHKITAKAIDSTGSVILLEAESNNEDNKILKGLLQSIAQIVIQDHSRVYLSLKNDLTSRLEQAKNSLNTIRSRNNQSVEAKFYNSMIESLSLKLAYLQNTTELSPPTQQIKPTGINKSLTIAIISISALFAGFIAVFFAEFITKVRERMNN